MTIKNKKKAGKATRGQLALIGVLSVVLVMVIVVQLPDSPEPVAARSSEETEPLEAVLGQTELSECADCQQQPGRTWPEPSLAVVRSFDPFAKPSWYQALVGEPLQFETSTEADQTTSVQLAELQETGAAIVLIAGNKRLATVGEQLVRVGDTIQGYEVSDITAEGVILTRPGSRAVPNRRN